MTDSGYETVDLGISGISDAVEIGAGGFGVVYRAVEADLGRTVAVKVLTGNLDEAARFRFERERRAMGTLSGHPNIVTIYRGGYTSAGSAYLVMEYLARGSLIDRLRQEGPIPWSEVLKFGVQLSGALETSHRAGVLHRDIKPGNVLYSGLGNAKLCDFGIARLHGAPETQSSVVTASLAHAPPEIIDGHRPDAVADVYSLASTLFELLSGMPPFVRITDESMLPILARIHTDPLPILPADQLPESMLDVLRLATAKDPADRPQTAYDFGRQLMEAQLELGEPVIAVPVAIPVEGADDGPGALIPPFPTTPSTPLPPPIARTSDPGPPSSDRPGATTGEGNVVPAATVSGDPVAQGPPALVVGESIPSTRAPAGKQTPGFGGRPGRPVLIGVGVLALVVLVGFALTRSGSGGDDGDGVGESPTDSTAVTTAPADQATSTSVGQNENDYPTYRRITDASGSISLDVPTAWSDVERGPGNDDRPFLAAAETLFGGYFDSFEEPGVAVTIVDSAAADLDVVLDRVSNDECRSRGRGDMTIPYRGRIESFDQCAGTETQLIHVVFVDSFQNVTALLSVQVLSDRDLIAADTITDSLVLENNS